MKKEFKAVCNNTTECFNAIIHALQLPRQVDPSSVKILLSYIDSIIDYYLRLEKQETIRYPIIYIPCAKDWAEEVCIEYVYYKIESIFDVERIKLLRKEQDFINKKISIPEGLGGKKARKYEDNVKKVRAIVREATCAETDVRNLIVCGKSVHDRIRGKQMLMSFLGDNPKTSITCSDAIDVENQYDDYNDFGNIFCFYSRNQICDTYASNAINWTGLKNCFIFEFDNAPYCLHNVLKNGEKLCENFTSKFLLSRSKENIYPDYITLTAEEAHYLFNEEPQNPHTIIHFPEKLEEDKEYILELYKGDDEYKFSIKDRNILSLCLCDEAKSAYIEFLKQEKPILFKDSMWEAVLKIVLQNIDQQEIVDKIITFVEQNEKVAFVICDAPDSIKKALKKFFENKGIKIKFYQYKDLKNKTIKEKRIVILRFCPHNISSQYYSYKNPNSFDEYSLKNDQLVLDIINEISTIDYSRYKYDYDLHLYAATKSTFRREKLGGELDRPQNPNVPYVSHYNSDLDDDACEQPQASTIPTVRFEYSDGTSVQLPENEVLICKNNNGDQFLEKIRDLKEHDQLCQIRAIQPIYELADETMNVFFNDERQTTTDLENNLRNEFVSQGLIPAEHNREIPIWKFLLDRKMRDYCVENDLIQYDQHESLWLLLHNNLEDERVQSLYEQIGVRVQLDTILRNWCDTCIAEPIVPGMKRDREKLFISYLELNRGILSLYRKKQLLTRDMTRTRNRITEGFLSRILFDDITDDLATELLEDSQYAEYLAIDTKADIETLKAIALEHINFKQIKSYAI